MTRGKTLIGLMLIFGLFGWGILTAQDNFTAVDKMPEMIQQNKPVYPDIAKKSGIEGKVTVKSFVDEKGTVTQTEIVESSGVESLDQSALEAARAAKFNPAMAEGKPVGVWVTYAINFKLGDKK